MNEKDSELDRLTRPKNLDDFPAPRPEHWDRSQDRVDHWLFNRDSETAEARTIRLEHDLRVREAACIRATEGFHPLEWGRTAETDLPKNLGVLRELEGRLAALHGRQPAEVVLLTAEFAAQHGITDWQDVKAALMVFDDKSVVLCIKEELLRTGHPVEAILATLEQVQYAKQLQARDDPAARPEMSQERRQAIADGMQKEKELRANGGSPKGQGVLAHVEDARAEARKILLQYL
jgi:hypothetical protein